MFRRGRIRRHCVCASLIAVVSVILRPVLAEDTNVIARFKIAKNGDGILVPVNVDGKEYMFLLDTGTTLTAFDSILLTASQRVRSPSAGPAEIRRFNCSTFRPPLSGSEIFMMI